MTPELQAAIKAANVAFEEYSRAETVHKDAWAKLYACQDRLKEVKKRFLDNPLAAAEEMRSALAEHDNVALAAAQASRYEPESHFRDARKHAFNLFAREFLREDERKALEKR